MANQVGVNVTRGTEGPIAFGASPGDKLFIALLAARGPANKPVLVTSWGAFERIFGGATPRTAGTEYSAGWENVKDWFDRVGAPVVALRVVGSGAVKASVDLLDRAGSPDKVFTVSAKGPGATYNGVDVVVAAGSVANTFKLTILDSTGAVLEVFDNLLSDAAAAQRVTDASSWVDLTFDATNTTVAPDNLPALGTFDLNDTVAGADDNDPNAAAIVGTVSGSTRTGLKALRTFRYRRGILIAPDLDTDPLVIAELKANALPYFRTLKTSSQPGATLTTVLTQRAAWNEVGCGFYFPRLVKIDDNSKRLKTYPPLAQIAGQWLLEMDAKGPGKPAAGGGFEVRGGLRLEQTASGDELVEATDAELLVANGINPIWDRDGSGPKVWGARAATSEIAWRDLQAARLYCVIGDAAQAALNSQVYEVVGDEQFDQLYHGAYAFLSELHRQGAFRGALPAPRAVADTARDAFAILVGPDVQSPADNEQNIVRMKIWFKPALVAETILVEVARQTG